MTEAEFLAHQADEAKRALTNTLRAIGGHVGQGVDPRQWTREHPVMMLGGAAVAGFVAAQLAQRPRRPKRRRESLTSDNHSNGKDEDPHPQELSHEPPPPSRGSVITKRLLREAVRAAQPVISGFIMSLIHPPHPPADGPPNTTEPTPQTGPDEPAI